VVELPPGEHEALRSIPVALKRNTGKEYKLLKLVSDLKNNTRIQDMKLIC
jgi:hypothetical protein